jgi:hypothetical protein
LFILLLVFWRCGDGETDLQRTEQTLQNGGWLAPACVDARTFNSSHARFTRNKHHAKYCMLLYDIPQHKCMMVIIVLVMLLDE